MKKITLSILLTLTMFLSAHALDQIKCVSPNGKAAIIIENKAVSLSYSVRFNKKTLIASSPISVAIKNKGSLEQFNVLKTTPNSVSEKWERVWGKKKNVINKYNEQKIELQSQKTGILITLYIRAYDDGVAMRYEFPKQDGLDSFELVDENIHFTFSKDYQAWVTDNKTFRSHQEDFFLKKNISEITKNQLIGMPMLVQAADDAYMVITEADLTNWSGAYLKTSTTEKNTLVTKLSPLPRDNEVLVKRETPAASPWRVIMLAENPGTLIESDIIANLNDPNALEDYSWIKPGASAWDWWWSNKYAPSVNFKVGPNQETMKFYIDFAAEMGWEYQLVDWQWYGAPFLKEEEGNPKSDITKPIDGIDIEELVKYANAKGVKIIIWLHWWHLQRQMDALALYEKWGVAGVKVDFMARQDQEMVNFYHDVAKKAAKHHLLVNFHGAYKPTGVSRTYPNLITREGVYGNEQTKWSDRLTPEHNVTLPFTRGLLGEMDYTPVAFRNVTPEQYKTEKNTEDHSPVVQSTRCHQLAMTVVYESALAVFCDAPDNYRKGVGIDFLKLVPTTWDETKVLNAAVGDYITIARRSGDNWFIGSMTDSTERAFTIDVSFLEKGKYHAFIWEDGKDANVNPMNAVKKELEITKEGKINLKLAKGGGAVVYLEKIK